MVICTTLFQMIVISTHMGAQFILLCCYFMTMMCQIAMYCYFGHNIMTSSSEITTACYMSNWLNFSVKVRKMLILIMERAKRPLIITAGRYFILNLATLMAILKASYSCLALLQRTYKN
ncbi:odorant receptor 30a-like [Aethina tumida]|uniref:odorant receptor 30a-like n=1 Tax=Aethina tumida TaxID=116153 RepID=UPI002147E4DD|nr:odorant receptor 30a-like [Aethina tumida]